jgi:uncharacterized repeat protein (TIGR02543 family)
MKERKLMKINKKRIITSIFMIMTLILTVFFAAKAHAVNTNTDVIDDEKTMVRMVTALTKGSDSVSTTNLQNGLNKYAGTGVATAGAKTGNVIPITFTATGNIYEIDINNGATFDDSSGGQVYTITYNANGGTGAPEVQTKIAGSAITLSTIKPTRTGYTFLGWSSNSSATTAEYASGAQFTTDANTTLYAVWQAEKVMYTVTLADKDGMIIETVQVEAGSSFELPEYDVINGNIHAGWAETAEEAQDGKEQYIPLEIIIVNSNLIFYAVEYEF